MEGLNLNKLQNDYVDTIFISGLPLPPSGNQQYSSIIRRSRDGKMKAVRTSSKSASKYKKQFSDFVLINMGMIVKARKAISSWNKSFIECTMYFAIEQDRLLTLKNEAKRLDVQNREKQILDLLSAALGIDDRIFCVTNFHKVIAAPNSEQVVAILKPKKLQTLAEVYESLDLRTL